MLSFLHSPQGFYMVLPSIMIVTNASICTLLIAGCIWSLVISSTFVSVDGKITGVLHLGISTANSQFENKRLPSSHYRGIIFLIVKSGVMSSLWSKRDGKTKSSETPIDCYPHSQHQSSPILPVILDLEIPLIVRESVSLLHLPYLLLADSAYAHYCHCLPKFGSSTIELFKVATYWPLIFLLIHHLFMFSRQIGNKWTK